MQLWFQNHAFFGTVVLAVMVWIPAAAFLAMTTRRWESVAFMSTGMVAIVPIAWFRIRRDIDERRREHAGPE